MVCCPAYFATDTDSYAEVIGVSDGVPASAVSATVGAVEEPPPADVTREGMLIVIPLAGSAAFDTASTAGRPKFVLDTKFERYWIGENAGFVENESAAVKSSDAATHRRDSSFPSAALTLCSV